MKVVVLKNDTVINGCKRVAGEIVQVHDGFDESLCRRVIKRDNPAPRPQIIEASPTGQV